MLALLVGLTACQQSTEPNQASAVSVWRHSLPGAPADLDPARAADRYAQFLVQNIYQTLYRYQYLARPYALRPDLAAAMPQVSEDGLTYIIEIRPGYRFGDDPVFTDGRGREVVAADVVYSLQRHFLPETRSQGAWLWRDRLDMRQREGECRGLCVLDRYRLAIHLQKPYPQLVHTLASPLSAVVAPEAVAAYGDELARRPVGSGPFRLAAFGPFEAVLERNEQFPGEAFEPDAEGVPAGHPLQALRGQTLPAVSRVQVQFIADDAARWVAFNSSPGLDFIRLPSQQVDQVLSSRQPPALNPPWRNDYRVALAPELGFVRLEFSMADPALGASDDPEIDLRNQRLRCAIVAADSWTQRRQLMYAGLGQVFEGINPPQVRMARTSRQPTGAVGFDGYFADLAYGAVAGLRGRQEFDYFRARLVDQGYPPEQISYRPFSNLSELIRAIGAGQINVYMMGWAMDYPDPINNYQLYYGPNALPGANFSRLSDAEYDRLFEQASVLAPSTQRDRLFDAMDARLAERCVGLSGYARESVFLVSGQWLVEPDNGPINGTMLRFLSPPAPSP